MSERRLILGTDIISSNPANSSPLAGKVQLLQHPDDNDDDYKFTRDTAGTASFKVRILIIGVSETDAQTTVDAVMALIAGLKSGEVKYEYDTGKTRFELPLAFSSSFNGVMELRAAGSAATIDVEFTSTAPDNLSTTPVTGAPAGAISALTWNMSTNPEGYSFAVGEVVFEDKASANTWVNGLDDGSGQPYWMGSEWTLMTNEVVFDERPSGFTGKADHVIRVKMQQQIAEVVGVAAMEVFRDWGWSLTKVERAPNNGRGFSGRGGRKPGHDVIVTGQMTPKIGKVGLLNPGDSSVISPSSLDALVKAGLDALVKDINDRLPHKWRELQRQHDVDARDSEITFTIKGVMTDPLSVDDIDFQERVSMRYVTDETDVVISDGSVRTFHSAAGIRVFLDHRLTVQSFKVPKYKMPAVAGGKWRPSQGTITVPEPDLHQNGTIIYRLSGATSWRRVPKDAGDIVQAPEITGTLSAKGLQTG